VCSTLFQTALTAMGTLTFAKMANVQTVGIGLYLALAVIQALSAGGVAGLRRRITALQAAVQAAKLTSEYAAIRQLQAEVSRLEISFQALNRTILWVVAGLAVSSIVYFGGCTIWQDSGASVTEVILIFAFYLVLPILIFGGSGALIRNRCKSAVLRVKEAERRFRRASFGA
jgi:hypothetical protein